MSGKKEVKYKSCVTSYKSPSCLLPSRMSNHIDKIFYINLKTRPDRQAEMESELQKFGLEAERFEAIPTPDFGIYGCGLSHLAVLKLAKERNYRNVLILEDDFEFLVTKDEFQDQLQQFFGSSLEYNVCMLAYDVREQDLSFSHENVNVERLLFAQTASGYIVNCNYYDTLIELYEEALPQLIATRRHWDYANDIVWRGLQQRDQWLYFKRRIGKQRASYSDNSGKFADYGF
jgi:glycosyl transferase family 25